MVETMRRVAERPSRAPAVQSDMFCEVATTGGGMKLLSIAGEREEVERYREKERRKEEGALGWEKKVS